MVGWIGKRPVFRITIGSIMNFVTNKRIRFSHCDPAGIVFYPRYAELCNEVVEDWFREALGIDFHTFHEKLRLGLPVIRSTMEYLATSTYGDKLTFSLQVKAIGNSSMTLFITASCNNRDRIRAELKVVMMSMDSMRAVAIDDEWRDRFSAFHD